MDSKFSKIIKNNMPWIILIVISIIFSFFSPNFFKIQNIINILNQNAFVIVCAIGITFIMMSGQIDLSVGYQMSLIGVTIGLLNKNYNIGTIGMILIAILMGVLLNIDQAEYRAADGHDRDFHAVSGAKFHDIRFESCRRVS